MSFATASISSRSTCSPDRCCFRSTGSTPSSPWPAAFVLHGLEDLAQDYAITLRQWDDAFRSQLEQVRALGFDERFIRKWTYYLRYCEAAFALRHISVVQTVHTRANNLPCDPGLLRGLFPRGPGLDAGGHRLGQREVFALRRPACGVRPSLVYRHPVRHLLGFPHVFCLGRLQTGRLDRARASWLIAILLLGNIAMSIYRLREAFQRPGGRPDRWGDLPPTQRWRGRLGSG